MQRARRLAVHSHANNGRKPTGGRKNPGNSGWCRRQRGTRRRSGHKSRACAFGTVHRTRPSLGPVRAAPSGHGWRSRSRCSGNIRGDKTHVAGGDSAIKALRQYAGCMSRLARITTEASVCHGKPVIRGLRYPVQMLLELLASGMSIEEVLADYPDLERDDLLAALEFAALTAGGQAVGPLGAA